jgi:hypothetical protein
MPVAESVAERFFLAIFIFKVHSSKLVIFFVRKADIKKNQIVIKT